MREQEKISVIIPIYKVEAYLGRCVASVQAQTYPSLEIILVDDGSPDGCPAMCDALARQDGRVRVIHKENGGLSSARNAGIDAAAGTYIAFVDGDDYIAPEMLERLYAAMMETGAGLSLCDYLPVDETGVPVREYPAFRREVLTQADAFEQLEHSPAGWRLAIVWNKLYRQELFRTLRFPVGKLHEDEFMVHHVFAQCGKIAVIPDRLYMYVQREGSIMTAPVTVKRLDAVEAFLDRYEFYRQNGYKSLAAHRLRRAYEILWTVMSHVDVREHHEAIEPYVRQIAREQARRLDPSAARLWLAYLRGLKQKN